MNIRREGGKLYVARSAKTEYPRLSILVAVGLLYLTPFVTSWLAAVSFVICLYRIVRYDARVFATDYCMLMPISALTKVDGGVALLIYLCLLAAIWYLIRSGLRANAAYVLLIILMNYLAVRMQMNINDFVLCFGQMFVLCVLLPKQDEDSSERAVKAFCVSLLVSSCYAFVFRNTSGLRVITGAAYAATHGTSIRFSGLFADPNYYMSFLTVGIALLLKLKDSGRIRSLPFWIQAAALTAFGILTVSKMFFLMFVLLVGVYVIWQYWNRRALRGFLLTIVVTAAMILVLTMENSPFAAVLERFDNARNLSDLTTRRSDIYALYIEAIMQDLQSFFFGKGLAAEGLYRDPHNLYLEIAYYTGIIGLILISSFYIAMLRIMIRRTAGMPKQNLIAKYMVFAVVLGLYFSLHGMFLQTLYGALFLAYLSIMVTRKPEEVQVDET